MNSFFKIILLIVLIELLGLSAISMKPFLVKKEIPSLFYFRSLELVEQPKEKSPVLFLLAPIDILI